MNRILSFSLFLVLIISCHPKGMLNNNKNLIYEDDELTFINFNNQALYLPIAKKDSIFKLIKENPQLQKLISDKDPNFKTYPDLNGVGRKKVKGPRLLCDLSQIEHRFNHKSLVCFDQLGKPLLSKMISSESENPIGIKCWLYRNMNEAYNRSKKNEEIKCTVMILKFKEEENQ